ncbi:MAG: IS30 family transposase [Flammeovirgaceae bacterium]|jgi:IS30 family transposase
MKHLTSEQRYTIERMLGNGYSQRKIAETIGVDESTVSKELKRNKDMRFFDVKSFNILLKRNY